MLKGRSAEDLKMIILLAKTFFCLLALSLFSHVEA